MTQSMTAYRTKSDGRNIPSAWKIVEDNSTVGDGEWILVPEEAASLLVSLDASAGAGYIEYTNDIDAVNAGTTPAPIHTWDQGETSTETKIAAIPAAAAFRVVNVSGTVRLVAIAKVSGSTGAPAMGDSSMAAIAATGSIAIAVGNVSDGDTIVLNDGLHAASTLEMDAGAQASGTVDIAAGNAADTDTVNLHSKTFQFNDGAAATGSIALEDGGGTPTQPLDGETITIDDGTNPASTFEFDSGAQATGSVEFTAQPSDGDTVTIDDGVNPAITFEADTGVAATGIITIASTPNDGDTVIVTDGIISVTFEADTGVKATGSVALTDQPADGSTVTIGDGTTTVTFEFDNNASVTPGNVTVTIGATLSDTVDNLITALTGTALTITPTKDGSAMDLEADTADTDHNVAITYSGDDIFVVGMTGGVAPGDAVTPGNIGFEICASDTDTASALIAAINGTALTITAAPSAPADTVCNLTFDSVGTAGNQTIDVTGAGGRITTTNLTGGLDAGTDVTPGNTGFAIGATKEDTAANLLAAINGAAVDVTASPTAPATALINLTADNVGTDANGGLSKVGANITVVNLAGGLAAGDAITPGNIGVVIGVDVDATMVNLIAAIVAAHATLTITPSAAVPADHTCTLAADTKDATHNVAITTTCTNAVIVGMSGGLDAGDNVTDPAYIGIAIGANAEASIDNLITAVKANLAVDSVATVKSAPGGGTYRMTVVWGVVGLVGNAVITVVGANLSKTDMTGGLDAGTAITPGNVGVVIGATNLITAANIAAAIATLNTANTLDITPTDGGAGTVTLINDRGGTDGNQTITKSGANISVTGMSGGKDALTWRDFYDKMTAISVDADEINIDMEVLGETDDTPAAGETLEDATNRAGISLWKRTVNKLIEIKAKLPSFGTAGSPSADVVTVQGAGGGTTLPVTEASAADIKTAVGASAATDGTTADAPTTGDTPEDATVKTKISLFKRIVNLLIRNIVIEDDVYNSGSHSKNVTETNPDDQKYDGPTDLLPGGAQSFTTSWADVGPEVAANGRTDGLLFWTTDINGGYGLEGRILLKHTVAGSEEYAVSYLHFFLKDADAVQAIPFRLANTVAYFQVQQRALNAGSTAETDDLYVSLSYNGGGTPDLVAPKDPMTHLIDSGRVFTLSDYDNDVDVAGPKYWLITTPNSDAVINMQIACTCSGPGLWEFFENPTLGGGGSALTPRNLDRNSSIVATTVIKYDETSGGDGTLIQSLYIGSGSTVPTRIGGEGAQGNKWRLKKNEDYFVKFTPDADDTKASINFTFSEELD